MPDKIIHQIQVDGYCACFGGKWGRLQLGTFGSYGIEQLQITLGDSWTDLVVYANFVSADGTTPVLVPESGLVDVPPEATAKPGMGNIVLDGTADGVRIYSVDVPYIMLNHSDLSGEAPAPTPDRWEQYVAQVKGYADAAAESAKGAAASEQNAADSAERAAQAAGEAAGAISQVQDAAKAALDDIATERETALEAVQTEGSKQESAIAGSGTAALEAIGQVEQAAINQVQQAGAEQVDSVNAAGNAQLDKINAANALVPTPTQEDAGKSIIVKSDGSGYELGDIVTDAYTKAESDARYAPIAAAIRPTVSGNPATLEHSVAWAMQGLNVYGKSTQVTTTGAQLFDVSSIYDVQKPSDSKDGVIPIYVYGVYTGFTANGYWSESKSSYSFDQKTNTFTVTGMGGYGIGILVPCNPSSNYCFSLGNQDQMEFAVAFYNQSGNFIRFSSNTNPKIFTTTEDCYYLMLVLRPAGTGRYRNLMLNSGSAVLPWEPYTGGKPSPSPDYPQEIVTAGGDGSINLTVSDGADQSQSMTFSTPNGLPGMPVSSGGNYTDSTGKEWICDEVDFDAGVYVQRIGKVTSYSGEYVEGHYMSTTGQLTTGATILYALAAPIETPLSAEELAAYAALRSYNGTTIVSTEDPVAGLSARYVADGAAYIDSKIQSAVTQAVAAAVSLTGGAQ